MRALVVLLTSALGIVPPATIGENAAGQTPVCALVEKLPTGAVQKASSVITTSQSSWDTTFAGGQSAFVRLESITPPHATPVTVRFFDKGPDGEKDNCSVSVLVSSLKSPIYSWSVFSAKPFYRLQVSLAADVDVGGVTVTAFTSKQ